MNRNEHLLWILAEECAEVAQRASKAARFGLEEVQPGQPLSNSRRILQEDGCLPADDLRTQIDAKKLKVEKFLRYSRERGTLVDVPSLRPAGTAAAGQLLSGTVTLTASDVTWPLLPGA